MRYPTIPCNANIIWCNAMPCNTIQYNAVSCNTKQCHTVQYHTVQCHTVSKIHTQIKKLKFSRCNQKLWLCYLRALQNCFCLVTGSKKNGSKRSKKCTFSDLAYHSSKSGKRIKQKSIPPFWGDVGVKKVVSVFGFGCSKSHFQAPENAQSAQPRQLFSLPLPWQDQSSFSAR